MVNEVSTKLLVLSMEMEAYKQQVAAINVANVNTKGYKPYTVSFTQALNAIEHSDSNDAKEAVIDKLSQSGVEDIAKININHQSGDVMLDEEILASSRASGRYQTMAELLNRRLGLIRMGIKGQ
ncbi:flagellar basal body rod protein FlgB [Vibrio vulnificus]|nr:hypothetical protein [Vibrio vulnificus]